MQIERLSPKEAADLIEVSISTLARWRHQYRETGERIGPKFVTEHGRVWYRKDWINEWEKSVWAKS